jgi:hypothetical protein
MVECLQVCDDSMIQLLQKNLNLFNQRNWCEKNTSPDIHLI